MQLIEKLRSVGALELLCIILLGIGSNFLMTGYDTSSFIMESVIHSVHTRSPSSIGEYAGYYGQAVIYITFTLANFFSPLLIRYANPKWSLVLGGFGFALYQCGFLYVNNYLYNFLAVVNGLGFATFYAGNGCYLIEHSTKKYLARNSSLAWGITSMSMTVGGIVLLIVFQQDTTVSADGLFRDFTEKEIRIIFGAFSFISFLCILVFLCLPKNATENSVSAEVASSKDKSRFSRNLCKC